MSIAELAEDLGVHPNTVRFHVESLLEQGQVRRVTPRHRAPGRPPLLFQAVVDRLPTLPELNAYATLPLTELQLAQVAYDHHAAATNAAAKPLEQQVRSLIESVWGKGAASDGCLAQ